MNKSINIVALSFLLIIQFSCNSLSSQNCRVEGIKTLFTTIGIHDNDTAYCHYTLISNFSRNCMDSVGMINAALRYCDTVKVGNPVNVVMFFNSEKNFIPNETSQFMEEINKSCLVVIGFDEKTRKPNNFIFYNEKGERLYWGDRWLPNG